MSLHAAKMGSLKEQLEQEERDAKAELEAITKDKTKAAKKEKVKKGKKED